MEAARGVSVAGAIERCPFDQTWIEIVLTDAEGEPVPKARYEVEAEDGSVHEGVLDADGCATVEGLTPGVATVRFPDYHGADFESEVAPACRCAQTTWVEIELADDAGRPAAGVAYEVVLPDGEVIEGKLDGDGKARVESLTPGACRVRFPELEQDACDLGSSRPS